MSRPLLPRRFAGRLVLALFLACLWLPDAAGTAESVPQAALGADLSGLPRIGFSDSVVHLQALRLALIPSPVVIKIFNESDVGVLQWSTFEDRSFLSANPGNATANTTDVAIWITNTDAPLGHHTAHLIVESNNAVNSPETVTVELDMLCPVQVACDANHDGRLSQADIIYLVNHILRGGPLPQPVWQAGDANCDEVLTQSDIIVLVNHLLRGGPSPCDVCQFF